MMLKIYLDFKIIVNFEIHSISKLENYIDVCYNMVVVLYLAKITAVISHFLNISPFIGCPLNY